MNSLIDFSNDYSYTDYYCDVRTEWGSTRMHAYTENELLAALRCVLPRGRTVDIILGDLDMRALIEGLRKSRYTVRVTGRKKALLA